MNDPTPPSFAPYCAAVDRLIDGMDRLLAQGEAARRRHDRLVAEYAALDPHGTVLTNLDSKPAGFRHVQERMRELTEEVYAQLLAPRPTAQPTTRQTTPRALAHRNRI